MADVTRAKPLVCFLLVLLALAATGAGWAAHVRQAALASRSTYDVTWIASQASVEFGRLATTIATDVGRGGPSADVGLRMDIFLARVSDFDAPAFRAFLASDAEAAATAARISDSVATLRQAADKAGAPPTTGAVRSAFGPLFAPLARLAGAAHRYGLARAEADQAGVSSLYVMFMVLAGGMTTCCAGLVLLLVKQNRRVSEAADRDALTGLANRLRLSRETAGRLAATRARGERFSVLYLDLDGFKPINDAFGHAVGDEVLKQVARRLEAAVTEKDFVARLGGDEFVVLQGGDPGPAEATTLAATVVGALSSPVNVGEQQLRVGTSVGIAMAPDDGVDADDLFRRADAALYRAKRGGAGRWCLALDSLASARELAA